MTTDLAALHANSTELGQIRRRLRHQKQPYHPRPAYRPTRFSGVVEVDEYELDLVEIFARHDLQMVPDAG